MTTNSDESGRYSAKLIYKLACKLTGKSEDEVTREYKYAMHLTQSYRIPASSNGNTNEQEVIENIKKALNKDKRDNDAVRLVQLHQKLLSCTIVKNRNSIIQFLFQLKDLNCSSNFKATISAKNISDISKKVIRMPSLSNEKGFWKNGTPAQNGEHNYEALRSFWQGGTRTEYSNKSVKMTNDQRYIASRGYSENIILRELLYAFQAISGQILKFDCLKEDAWIEPKAGLSDPVRQQMLKMAELGLLYNRVNKYYVSIYNRHSGLVEQSFVAALHDELNEYYRILAVLESQLHQEDEQCLNTNGNNLTMSSLFYWALDPINRFKVLASLIDTCKGLKGGALASAIYVFRIHGDPAIRNLIKKIWNIVSVPIYQILKKWVIEGELEDTYEEFFVASVPGISKDRLWDEKYRLREKMVPSFITVDQAYKILSTGKSINFLRHVCLDKKPLHERRTISMIIDQNCADSMFSQDYGSELHKIIDVTYKETSCYLLNVMHSKYKFMDHLKAMRRYLLLGQGDFIRHLMDLLEPYLNQSADTLYMQNLSGILDTAIRSTNAQFDDQEILKRLDNRLMEVSAGDCGWDIYTLDYKIDGPIGTVFTPKVMKLYLQLFHYLWKAKRMEYSLSELWRIQMAFSRGFRNIPELLPLMHQCHVLTSEMVHFIQQMQYYITFEVMECSWDELERKVKAAEDLDKVIIAHEEFLETIITRALLDDCSEDLRMQLQTIYNLIIQFKVIQDELFVLANSELNLRLTKMLEIKKDFNSDLYDQKVKIEKSRQAEFISKIVMPTKAKLRILSASYQDMVKKFLLMLTSHRDENLKFLSFRLDFNSHYKMQDARLHTSLTFQNRRQSSITRLL